MSDINLPHFSNRLVFICWLVILSSITDLEKFILRVDSGLREPVKSGDYQVLVQVMGCLLAVRSRQPSTDQMFTPLTAVVSLLQQYGETLPDHIYTQLEVVIFISLWYF